MLIQREIEERTRKKATLFPVLIVTGARQVGKSTLLKKTFIDCDYVSLDLPGDIAAVQSNPELFFSKYKKPLIIDEVQNAPELFQWIKYKVDQELIKDQNDNHKKKSKLQFILSGSQKFSLIKNVQESLAGRALIIELLPLSLKEIFHYDDQYKNEYRNLILRGGYPALYKDPDIEPSDYFYSYLQTYLERDVKDILNVTSLRDFERFLRLMAFRSANLINKAEVAKDVGVSPTTINEWISVLQASHQIHLLEPIFNNRSKSIIKTPKVYFYDTGLLCFLLNIKNQQTLLESPYKGAIWENFVFSELYKNLNFVNMANSLGFWRDRSKEIDFVVNRGGLVDLFEVKWETEPDAKAVSNMIDYQKKYVGYNEKIQSKTVLCPTNYESFSTRTIKDQPFIVKGPFDFNF